MPIGGIKNIQPGKSGTKSITGIILYYRCPLFHERQLTLQLLGRRESQSAAFWIQDLGRRADATLVAVRKGMGVVVDSHLKLSLPGSEVATYDAVNAPGVWGGHDLRPSFGASA